MIFMISYLILSLTYAFVVHCCAGNRLASQGKALLPHPATTFVALLSFYVFFVLQGSAVRQISADDESGVSAWQMWVGLWPLCLLLMAASLISHFVWLITLSLSKRGSRWLILVATGGIVIDLLAFRVLLIHFPDA